MGNLIVYVYLFFTQQSLGTNSPGLHPSEEFHPPPVKAQGRDKPDYTLVTSLLNLSKSEVMTHSQTKRLACLFA